MTRMVDDGKLLRGIGTDDKADESDAFSFLYDIGQDTTELDGANLIWSNDRSSFDHEDIYGYYPDEPALILEHPAFRIALSHSEQTNKTWADVEGDKDAADQWLAKNFSEEW